MKKLSLIIILSILLQSVYSQCDKDEFRKLPYLIYYDSPNNMDVLWQTTGTYNCIIKWGLTQNYEINSVQTAETASGTDEHQHIYSIGSLTAGTMYYYKVIVLDPTTQITSSCAVGSFITAPNQNATEVSFYGYGDTRGNVDPPTPPANHNSVCGAILDEFSSSNDPDSQTFLLHSGDWNYDDSEFKWDQDYFNTSHTNAIELKSKLAVMGAYGNHEYTATNYKKYWPYNYPGPSTGFCYSMDYGPVHVCFIELKNEYSSLSVNDKTWIENDLCSTDKKWKVLVFHAPIYSSGKNPTTNKGHDNNTIEQSYLQSVCINNGVQLVLNGHNHYYAHWLVDGVHHLTLGGGGAETYTPNPNISDPQEIETEEIDHFGKFSIDGNTMEISIIEPSVTLPFEEFTIQKDYTFCNNDDVIWEDGQSGLESIKICDGSKLTIKSTVSFLEDGLIIVERGGKLVIDGGILTNTCGNLWQGIQVYGDASLSQNYSNQGAVEIINDGTIENAVCGIETIMYSASGTPDLNYTGGIVGINGGIFKNNTTAIKFWNYSYANSISLIGNCQFIADDNILDGTDPGNFVELSLISGVSVASSSFTDARSGISTTNLITGINCFEAYINVFSGCEFTDLNYGIYATTFTTTTNIDIKDSEFIDNYRGIYIGGMTAPRVTSNIFELKYSYNLLTDGYGLYLDESTDYWVEDNTFNNCDDCGTSRTGVGIIVNESGGDANEIYLNEFNYVENAINVQGQNRQYNNGNIGLVIRCNEYNDTKADETIFWPGSKLTKTAGIAGLQGQGSLLAEDMAGNIFHHETSTTDFDDLNNEANLFLYYYSNNSTVFEVQPLDATWSTVTAYGIPTNPWIYDEACESTIHTGGGGGTGDDREKMSAAQSEIETTEAILTALVDGGDTESLNTEVETSTPPEAVQVYNELMAESPNLSETVVESTIEKENILPNAMVRDVMVANPHTAKSLVLLDKLDERFDPMPEYMKAQILAGRSIQTLKQELEAELAGHQMDKAKAMNNIIRYYKEEETDPAVVYTELVNLFQADNTLKSTYRLAWLYLEKGEYQLGSGIINNIPTQFSLTDAEQLVYDGMDDIYNILSGLYPNGNTLEDLNTGQLSDLHSLASGEVLTTRAYARNILISIGELEYEEPILHVDLSKSAQAMEDYNKLMKTKAPQMLSVYPNPSTNYVILEYNLETEAEAVLEIKDVNGQTIRTIKTAEKQDQVTVTTEDWKPGLYIATLKINGKSIESVKFTLVK